MVATMVVTMNHREDFHRSGMYLESRISQSVGLLKRFVSSHGYPLQVREEMGGIGLSGRRGATHDKTKIGIVAAKPCGRSRTATMIVSSLPSLDERELGGLSGTPYQRCPIAIELTGKIECGNTRLTGQYANAESAITNNRDTFLILQVLGGTSAYPSFNVLSQNTNPTPTGQQSKNGTKNFAVFHP